MATTPTTTGLPAPLSLTLDEISQVSGGLNMALISATLLLPKWYWFGQPPIPYLTGLQTAVTH